jgi:hypothetical protein
VIWLRSRPGEPVSPAPAPDEMAEAPAEAPVAEPEVPVADGRRGLRGRGRICPAGRTASNIRETGGRRTCFRGTGPGMSVADRDRLFRAFAEAASMRSRIRRTSTANSSASRRRRRSRPAVVR